MQQQIANTILANRKYTMSMAELSRVELAELNCYMIDYKHKAFIFNNIVQ